MEVVCSVSAVNSMNTPVFLFIFFILTLSTWQRADQHGWCGENGKDCTPVEGTLIPDTSLSSAEPHARGSQGSEYS